jgi:hypothetical protein
LFIDKAGVRDVDHIIAIFYSDNKNSSSDIV